MTSNNLKTINRHLTRCSILLLMIAGIHAIHAQDLYTLGANKSRSSDDIYLQTWYFRYISNRREQFWPYEESADSDWDLGFEAYRYSGDTSDIDFSGRHLIWKVGRRYSGNSYLQGNFGAHRLDVPDAGGPENRLTYELNAKISVSPNFDVSANTSDNYVYHLGLQPAGALEYLHARQRRARFNWRPTQRMRISGATSLWNLSDSNTRRAHHLRFLYGISPAWPWIWAGMSYEKLRYDHAMPGYWTPGDYVGYNLEFESSFPIFKNLVGSLSGSLSHIKEDNNPIGNGDSVAAGVDYKLTDIVMLRAQASRISSVQRNSDWSETLYQLSINGSF